MAEEIKKSWWRYRWWIVFILAFCYSVQYLDRMAIGIVAPLMINDMGLTYAQYGNGTALMLVFYGPMQAIVGAWCDRFGAKKILLFSVICWGLLTIWMTYIHSIEEWYVRQVIFGIVCATEWIPSARIATRWFPKRQRAQSMSVLSCAWILTPAWAPIFVTTVVNLIGGWRPFFIVAAAIAIIPFVFILVWIFERPEQKKNLPVKELLESYEDEINSGLYTAEEVKAGQISEEKIATQRVSFMEVVRYPGFLKIGLAFITVQAVFWASVSWIPLYLKETFGFSLTSMGWWASAYFAGGVLGSFIGSRLSDKVFKGRRKPVAIFSLIGIVPFLIAFATFEKGTSQTVLLLTLTICGFIANSGWGAWNSWPAEIFNVEVYPKALGLITAMAYFFGAAGAPLVMSRLVIQTEIGVSYAYAWIFIAVLAIAGSILTFSIREKKR